MNLLPIQPTIEANAAFANDPIVKENLPLSVAYYDVIGFEIPWVCYYAMVDGKLVGAGAFKGAPKNGRVEIAYETFKPFQNQGIGNRICQALVEIAQNEDSNIQITAQTLRECNHSTRILTKNGFTKIADLVEEDGTEVWEWELPKPE